MKLSPAQAALLHVAESAAASALMTLVIGIWGQIATDQTSWSTLFVVFGSGFVAALGLIYKSVMASPALKQAESDTTAQIATEAKTLAEIALRRVEAWLPFLAQIQAQAAQQPVAMAGVIPPIGAAGAAPFINLPQKAATQPLPGTASPPAAITFPAQK